MFHDELEDWDDDVNKTLEVYSLEEILQENDMTITRALTLLLIEGYIVLPEEKSL